MMQESQWDFSAAKTRVKKNLDQTIYLIKPYLTQEWKHKRCAEDVIIYAVTLVPV